MAATHTSTDTIKAMRRMGRETNQGFVAKGGPHGHRGKAATRNGRRSAKQNGWS